MTYADSAERSAFIAGVRLLADYLESNPEVPTPVYSYVHAFPPESDWAEMCAEIDATAELLGTVTRVSISGHYVAARSFGPVEYQAVAIPRKESE